MSRGIILPDPAALKVIEPEHLRAAAAVVELADKLPAKIASDADVLRVQEVMRRASSLFGVVDGLRSSLKKPIDALAKHVQAQAKRVLDPMDAIETECKDKLRSYTIARERERQRKEAEEMEKAEAQGRSTPDLTAEPPRAVATAFQPKIPTRVTRVATVTDPSLLPDEYWIPNQTLINERALGTNPVAIPGVTVSSEVSVVNR